MLRDILVPWFLTKMAARSDAAATLGPKSGVFMSVSLVSSSSNCLNLSQNHQINTRKHIYDRQSLLEIGSVYKHQHSPVNTEKLQCLSLLLKPNPETAAHLLTLPAQSGNAGGVRGDRSARVKRGGIRARLRANPTRPAIPSLMLSSVRSLENKLDLNQLSRSTQHETRDCCVFVFTETWLNDNIPDSTIQLHGLNYCRVYRDSSLSGKTHRVLSSMYDQKLLLQHCNTGTCLKRRPPTTTTQTCSSTLKL